MLCIELEAFSGKAIAIVTEDDGIRSVQKIDPVPASEIIGKVRQKPDGTVERLERRLTAADFQDETP
jgi:hypothetical protein